MIAYNVLLTLPITVLLLEQIQLFRGQSKRVTLHVGSNKILSFLFQSGNLCKPTQTTHYDRKFQYSSKNYVRYLYSKSLIIRLNHGQPINDIHFNIKTCFNLSIDEKGLIIFGQYLKIPTTVQLATADSVPIFFYCYLTFLQIHTVGQSKCKAGF